MKTPGIILKTIRNFLLAKIKTKLYFANLKKYLS